MAGENQSIRSEPIRSANGRDFRTNRGTIRVSRTRSTRVRFNWTRERQVAIIGRIAFQSWPSGEKPNSPRVILVGPLSSPLDSPRGISYGRRDHVSIALFSLDDSFDVSANDIPLRTSVRTCKHLTVFLRDRAATRETSTRFKTGKNNRGEEILLDRC